MAGHVLEVQNVTKRYGSAKRGDELATLGLAGVSFFVDEGEFVGIMGPSGSGKSTLLNCISTIDVVTSGSIRVAGRDITTLSSKELSRFRRDELGFVFQDSNLLDTLTVRENIALALTIQKAPSREIPARVEDMASRLSIAEVLDKYPYQISGGQKQRAAAARAVITRPSLVLADEPTGALDSKSSGQLLETFELLNRLGSTIVMVTHDAFTASWCSRIIFIKDGKLWGQLRREQSTREQFFAKIVAATTQLGIGGGPCLLSSRSPMCENRRRISPCTFSRWCLASPCSTHSTPLPGRIAVARISEDTRQMVELLGVIISGVSLFIAVILAFLVIYANRFLIKRRNKEFALYLTLGMRKSDLFKVSALETCIVGALSLVVGLALGIGISQVLSNVAASMFDTAVEGVAFSISAETLVYTVAVFAVIFFATVALNTGYLFKAKLIDLLHGDRKNEVLTLRSLPLSFVLFVVSCVIIGVSSQASDGQRPYERQ